MLEMNIHAAKTQLSRLVEQAAGGQEVVIARAGKPVARLVGFAATPALGPRVLGVLAGRFRIPADFDRPLPDDVLEDFERG